MEEVAATVPLILESNGRCRPCQQVVVVHRWLSSMPTGGCRPCQQVARGLDGQRWGAVAVQQATVEVISRRRSREQGGIDRDLRSHQTGVEHVPFQW